MQSCLQAAERDKARKAQEGAGSGQSDDKTQAIIDTNQSMSNTMDTMRNNMNERGEKLRDLAQK